MRMHLYAGVAVGSLVVGAVIERAAFRAGFAAAAAMLVVGPPPCPPCSWGTSTWTAMTMTAMTAMAIDSTSDCVHN